MSSNERESCDKHKDPGQIHDRRNLVVVKVWLYEREFGNKYRHKRGTQHAAYSLRAGHVRALRSVEPHNAAHQRCADALKVEQIYPYALAALLPDRVLFQRIDADAGLLQFVQRADFSPGTTSFRDHNQFLQKRHRAILIQRLKHVRQFVDEGFPLFL